VGINLSRTSPDILFPLERIGIARRNPLAMIPDSQLTSRHFTDSAKRVVRHICERAIERHMVAGELTEATAEMLAILSMLRWERKLGKAAMERLVEDCDALARELDGTIARVGKDERRPDGPQVETLPSGQASIVVDMGPPLKKLLDQAERESQALGQNWVGTEHLMLAAIHSECPELREVLRRYGVDYDKVKQAILDLICQ
jgi:ATP-dependent Clp protease ATP-binding subunit ClpA